MHSKNSPCGDPPIGLKSLREKSDQQAGFQEDIGDMSPGDKLFVFTDGIFDYQDRAGNFFGSNRLYEELRRLPGQPVSADIKSIEGALAKFGDQAPLHDDMTLLGIEYLGAPDI